MLPNSIYFFNTSSRPSACALLLSMNRHRRSRRLRQLVQLLAFASTASAVSLQDFQTITIFQVPSLSCLAAYGSTISGCSRSDFKDGVQCSESCAEGVQRDQEQVTAACKHVEVNDGSLLGLALQGGLLNALCPNFQTTSVTLIVKPTTTHTFLTPSQTQTTPTTLISTTESSTAITTPTPNSSIESSTPVTTQTTSSTESSTTAASTSSDVNTTVASVTPTETGGTTTVPSTSTPSPTQTDSGEDNQSDHGSSGGGSPFDTVFTGGAERILKMSTSVLTALSGTLITAFLMS
ncbi:hypothetical protein F4678DRAFT_212942 [Xylaria arbuscula]|nr:hypothetical protein F4678DRAFT_212942 [Xylaria arbuscula]